jgi:hypothetical protein
MQKRSECRPTPARRVRACVILLRGLVLVLLVLFGPTAHAIDGDILNARASIGVMSDANLFRLPDSAMLPNDASRSDLIQFLSAGIDFDRDWSAQRFRASLSVRDSRYSEYSQLDGIDYSGEVGWTLLNGDRNSLEVSASRSRRTLGFADARVLGRPVVDTASFRLGGALEFSPRWSAIAAVGRADTVNAPASRSVLDYTSTFVEVGARYDWRTGSRFDLVWRHSIADFVSRSPLGFENGYAQDDVGVRLDWRITEATALTGRVGVQFRDYADPFRESFIGPGVSLNADWRPRGGLQIVTSLRSELSAAAEINASYARLNGVSSTASWLATGKTTLRTGVDMLRRDFRGSGSTGLIDSQRRDTLTAFIAGISVQVGRTFEVGVDLRLDRRSSNVDAFDYATRIVTLRAGTVF